MKLIDFLEIYDENENLTVTDANDDFLDSYNGKDAINPKYNDCEIIKVYPLNFDTTVVMINR